MRIQSSSVQLSAQHLLVEKHQQTAQLQVWGGQQQTTKSPGTLAAGRDMVTLTRCCPPITKPETAAVDEAAVFDLKHPQLTILRLYLERLTGHRIIIFRPGPPQQLPDNPPTSQPAAQKQPGAAPARNQDWGMVFNYHDSISQSESTSFKASGSISTADGQQISFAVELQMSREYRRETNFSLRSGAALQDPLVLNLSGAPVSITPGQFAFDLNNDGKSEQIGFVRSGSAFLVLDKNNDGAINDGSELFGPTSGDGYQELAGYDDDNSGWIDAADQIFERLQLWTGEESDFRQLLSLGAGGIGAIFLGRIETPFALNNSNNEQQGMVRESGIFAREDGSVGTMQQIDMVA